jgi:tetratricopeptide (TPR) repeat protein
LRVGERPVFCQRSGVVGDLVQASELISYLPSEFSEDKIRDCVQVRAGMNSRSGETYLLVHDDTCVALSRSSPYLSFRPYLLNTSSIPKLEATSTETRLLLLGKDGIEYWLPLADQDSAPVFLFLDQLYTHTKQWGPLVETIQIRQKRALDREQNLELRLRLAKLWIHQLVDIPAALQALEEILTLDGSSSEALEILEYLFQQRDGDEQVRIAQMLEPLYLNCQSYQSLYDMIAVLVSEYPSEPETASEQSVLWIRQLLGLALEHLADFHSAQSWAEWLLYRDPMDQPAWQAFSAALEHTNNWTNAVDLARSCLPNLTEAQDISLYELRIATILHERLAETPLAKEACWNSIKALPSQEDAYRYLETIYTQEQEWVALTELFQYEIAQKAEIRTQINLYQKQALVFQERLDDITKAIEIYEKILEIDAFCADAQTWLKAQYLVIENWEGLFRILELQSEQSTNTEERCAIELELVQIARNQFQDTKLAITHLRKLIELDPHPTKALLILAKLLGQDQQWAALIPVLERLVDLAKTPKESLPRLKKIARLWQNKLADPHQARKAWQRAEQIAPDDTEILWGMYNLAEQARDNPPILALGTRLLPTAEPEDKVRILVLRAQILEKNGELDESISCLYRVIELEPTQTQASQNLERLLRSQQRWKDLLKLWEQQVQVIKQAEKKTEHYLKTAELYRDQLNQPAQAIALCKTILSITPTHSKAFSMAEQLCNSESKWSDLIDFYLQRSENEEKPSEQLRYARKAADIALNETKEPARRFEILRSMMPIAWKQHTFVQELASAAHASGSLKVLAEEYLDLIGKQTDPGEIRKLKGQMREALRGNESPPSIPQADSIYLLVAQTAYQRHHDAHHAAEWLQRILAFQPQHKQAWWLLREVWLAEKQWRKCSELLENMREHRRWSVEEQRQILTDLIHVYQQLKEHEKAQTLEAQLKTLKPSSINFLLVLIVLSGVTVGVWYFLKLHH